MSAPDTVAILGQHAFHCLVADEWWVECLGCDWTETGDSDLSQAEAAHRAHLAAVLDAHFADRERAAAETELFEFVQWVASNRAHNGSDYKHGQSLYNEFLNEVLRNWAAEFATYRRTDKEADRG